MEERFKNIQDSTMNLAGGFLHKDYKVTHRGANNTFVLEDKNRDARNLSAISLPLIKLRLPTYSLSKN